MDWAEITERTSGDVTILDLRGQPTVCEGRGPLFRRVIKLVKAGRTKILVNLLHLYYIDSQGIGDIVQGFKISTQHGGSLKLCAVHERIQEVLKITRLVAVVEAYDSEEQALEAFRE